jgi:hypothetical protein
MEEREMTLLPVLPTLVDELSLTPLDEDETPYGRFFSTIAFILKFDRPLVSIGSATIAAIWKAILMPPQQALTCSKSHCSGVAAHSA